MSDEPIVRKVLMSDELFTGSWLRAADGSAITIKWGEPDADGFHVPEFTKHADVGFMDMRDGHALRLLREALPEGWGWAAATGPESSGVAVTVMAGWKMASTGHGATVAEAADAARAALEATK